MYFDKFTAMLYSFWCIFSYYQKTLRNPIFITLKPSLAPTTLPYLTLPHLTLRYVTLPYFTPPSRHQLQTTSTVPDDCCKYDRYVVQTRSRVTKSMLCRTRLQIEQCLHLLLSLPRESFVNYGGFHLQDRTDKLGRPGVLRKINVGQL